MEDKCSNCGHGFDERCIRCGRLLGCGSASILCGFDYCEDSVIPFTIGERISRESILKIIYDVPPYDPEYGPNGKVYP